MNPSIALFTIISRNYLHFAQTLFSCVKKHHPDYSLFCVMVDTGNVGVDHTDVPFEIISCNALGIPSFETFAFQYTMLEANTAVKPWAFETLLNRGFDHVIFVDPDVYFYSPMAELEQLFRHGAEIILTPHLLASLNNDERRPTELDIRRTGAYNLGFCALADSASARSLISWWQTKLAHQCVVELEHGLFLDQTWMDLVPGLFPNVSILRNPGYNVAYWNIGQRRITRGTGGSYFVGNTPLVFFHFSGIDLQNPQQLSKFQNRFTIDELGDVEEIVLDYVTNVKRNGAHMYSALPYGFSRFADGEIITDEFRKLYRTAPLLRHLMGPNPFECSQALHTPFDGLPVSCTTPSNAMMATWFSRPALQRDFPLDSATSIYQYFKWFLDAPEVDAAYSRTFVTHHNALFQQFTESLSASHTLTLMSGTYPPESDVRQSGIWASDRVSVPIINDTDQRLFLLGTYFPDSIRRQTGDPTSTLTFLVDRKALHSVSLHASGDFVIDLKIEQSSAARVSAFQIVCSKYFVPSEIGPSDDHRYLSWRLKKLSIGAVSIFDSARVS